MTRSDFYKPTVALSAPPYSRPNPAQASGFHLTPLRKFGKPETNEPKKVISQYGHAYRNDVAVFCHTKERFSMHTLFTAFLNHAICQNRTIAFICATTAFLGGTAVSLKAAIDPNLVQEMRDNAPEILLIQVNNVVQTGQNADQTFYRINATVSSVHRSEAGYKKGDKIEFESYTVSSDARRRGFVGPKSPQKLSRNWYGWAYLSDEFSNGLGPAAYGDSFQKMKR